jgi:hypothetical protein
VPVGVEVIGALELISKLEQGGPALLGGLEGAITDCQYRLQATIRRYLSGELLQPRTGHLRESATVNPIERTPTKITGPVGVNEPYAAIQNFGGTIVPKRARALTIPLDAVKTGVGVARYSAREVFDNPGIGGFSSVFIRKGIIFGVTDNGIKPLFVLKQSVTIRGVHYMERSLEDLTDEIQARIGAAVEKVIGA